MIKKEDMSHVETIHLNIDVLQGGIEIEGLSIYKNFLLITDEKNGKLFSFNLKINNAKANQIFKTPFSV